MVVLEGLQKEIGSSVAVIENKTPIPRCGLRRSIYRHLHSIIISPSHISIGVGGVNIVALSKYGLPGRAEGRLVRLIIGLPSQAKDSLPGPPPGVHGAW